MKLSTLKPPDPRLRIPCTELPAVLAKLEREGKRVLGMERQRNRRNGATFYILTIVDKSPIQQYKQDE